ncbi:MAG: hypothetical protein ACE5IR_04785 [bacterium]
MTELLIKVDPKFAREFKEISLEVFQGNDTRTFQQAVQLLRLLRGGNHFERFWEIAEHIRENVHKAGDLSEKEIDRLIFDTRVQYRNNDTE